MEPQIRQQNRSAAATDPTLSSGLSLAHLCERPKLHLSRASASAGNQTWNSPKSRVKKILVLLRGNE